MPVGRVSRGSAGSMVKARGVGTTTVVDGVEATVHLRRSKSPNEARQTGHRELSRKHSMMHFRQYLWPQEARNTNFFRAGAIAVVWGAELEPDWLFRLLTIFGEGDSSW